METELIHTAPIIDTDSIDSVGYTDLLDYIEDSIFDRGANIALNLTHTLTKGLYSREVFLPKGTILTSKVHKEPHQFLLLKGKMIIINEEGAVQITAPFHGTTMPSSTRIGVALEDSIWTTFHNCDLVEDKEYTKEELKKLVLEIEDHLVEDRRLLINSNNEVI